MEKNNRFKNSEKKFKKILEKYSKYQIEITGHSLGGSIALYMPPTVSVTYTANYTDTPIGSGAAAGLRIIREIAEGRGLSGAAAEALSPESINDMADAAAKLGLSAAGAIPGFQGTRELYEMNQGYIMTNRMELAFKGVAKRAFQYTFKMIPKSE